ncbi:unnamed protein product [Protopolystoma xenopodis]|uniref:Uncharacterized protein n=1 Tax=Protopolystoma xenopodis TaxID=117903 RepID=A0A448X4A8_9PLAT|nr:unnamed protein product [Protopolystoma xenopodis]
MQEEFTRAMNGDDLEDSCGYNTTVGSAVQLNAVALPTSSQPVSTDSPPNTLAISADHNSWHLHRNIELSNGVEGNCVGGFPVGGGDDDDNGSLCSRLQQVLDSPLSCHTSSPLFINGAGPHALQGGEASLSGCGNISAISSGEHLSRLSVTPNGSSVSVLAGVGETNITGNDIDLSIGVTG